MKRLSMMVAALALLGALSTPAAAQNGYVVIVNDANPTSQLSKSEVASLFLKRTSRWNNGQEVLPVDLAENSPVRARFSEDVHEKSVSSVKSFWQRQIFSGRAVPPPEKSSDAEVVAYVRANPNAIGYVSPGASLGSGVKRLRVTSG